MGTCTLAELKAIGSLDLADLGPPGLHHGLLDGGGRGRTAWAFHLRPEIRIRRPLTR